MVEARGPAARSQAEARTNAVERFASQRRCRFAISAVTWAGSRGHFSDLLSTPGAGPPDQAKERNRSGVPVGHCSAADFASGAARLTRRSVLEHDLVECSAIPAVEGRRWWPCLLHSPIMTGFRLTRSTHCLAKMPLALGADQLQTSIPTGALGLAFERLAVLTLSIRLSTGPCAALCDIGQSASRCGSSLEIFARQELKLA